MIMGEQRAKIFCCAVFWLVFQTIALHFEALDPLCHFKKDHNMIGKLDDKWAQLAYLDCTKLTVGLRIELYLPCILGSGGRTKHFLSQLLCIDRIPHNDLYQKLEFLSVQHQILYWNKLALQGESVDVSLGGLETFRCGLNQVFCGNF